MSWCQLLPVCICYLHFCPSSGNACVVLVIVKFSPACWINCLVTWLMIHSDVVYILLSFMESWLFGNGQPQSFDQFWLLQVFTWMIFWWNPYTLGRHFDWCCPPCDGVQLWFGVSILFWTWSFCPPPCIVCLLVNEGQFLLSFPWDPYCQLLAWKHFMLFMLY